MMIITLNIPQIYIDAIAKLIDQKLFPSRSEAIRVALRDFLKNESRMIEIFMEIHEKNEKPDEIKPPEIKTRKIDMRKIRRGWEK